MSEDACFTSCVATIVMCVIVNTCNRTVRNQAIKLTQHTKVEHYCNLGQLE